MNPVAAVGVKTHSRRCAALRQLLPIEAGAAVAYGSAGASDPCHAARFLQPGLVVGHFSQRQVEQGRHFFLEFQQDAQLVVLGFQSRHSAGVTLPGGFLVLALLVRLQPYSSRPACPRRAVCGSWRAWRSTAPRGEAARPTRPVCGRRRLL